MNKEEYEIWFNKNIVKNKLKLLSSGSGICYYCFKMYPISRIIEWVDRGETAICPECGIDSVLAYDVKNHEEQLKEIREAHNEGFKWKKK